MGRNEQHQALPPSPANPLCATPFLCPSALSPSSCVCVPVCLSVRPSPQLPRALPSPAPTLGCPLSLCPYRGHSTAVGTPHGQPLQWGWSHLSPMLWGGGGPGVAALPTPPALPAWAGGAPGLSALPLPNQLCPLCASVSPLMLGGGTRCHCLPSALRPTCTGADPTRAGQLGPPHPPLQPPALLKGRGTSRIYVIPPSLFKDPRQSVFYLFILL